jgi:peptidoglycan hydrolase CwlO-like protein
LYILAFLIALSPDGRAQTITALEARLKAEQAAMDSLNLNPLPSQEAPAQPDENTSLNIADEINSLNDEIDRTEQQLRQAQSQLKNREQNIAQRTREIYKIGRQGILSVLFSAKSLRDAAQRLLYLSRLKDQDQRDVQVLRVARKRVNILFTILSSQKRRQQILLQRKRQHEQISKH